MGPVHERRPADPGQPGGKRVRPAAWESVPDRAGSLPGKGRRQWDGSDGLFMQPL